MARIFLIPVPIGNLEDITFRAIRLLKEADLIAAEDTRNTGFLLKHYEIPGPMTSLHAHNEHKRVESLLDQVEIGEMTLAVVSDAGTPGISDPGFLIVREAIKREIPVETLPGATAFVPALVNSGLPCDRFAFEGFLPPKKGRKTRLEKLQSEDRTLIFYESPYRLVKTLKEFVSYFGPERVVSVSRELTKLHEENVRGPLEEVISIYEGRSSVKGEIVIVLAGQA